MTYPRTQSRKRHSCGVGAPSASGASNVLGKKQHKRAWKNWPIDRLAYFSCRCSSSPTMAAHQPPESAGKINTNGTGKKPKERLAYFSRRCIFYNLAGGTPLFGHDPGDTLVRTRRGDTPVRAGGGTLVRTRGGTPLFRHEGDSLGHDRGGHPCSVTSWGGTALFGHDGGALLFRHDRGQQTELA